MLLQMVDWVMEKVEKFEYAKASIRFWMAIAVVAEGGVALRLVWNSGEILPLRVSQGSG
jgi:hypothetical protein